MAILFKVSSLVLTLIAGVITPSFVFAQAQNLSLDEILSRMQQARSNARGRSVAYTVTREYQLAGTDAERAQSEVIADINILPPSQEDYAILKSEGNDRGEKVIRKILDHETAMAGHHDLTEISPRNYDFTLLGRDPLEGHSCYVLQLKPKREAVELLRGTAWVDANSFEIRRVEGTPAKSPSFWIKNLQVTMDYGEMQGVWLQLSTKAVADVRLAGTHVLTSHATDLRTAAMTASTQGRVPVPRAPASSVQRAIANSGVWVAH